MSPEPYRYAAKIDLAMANDPHVLAIGRVPANSRVLDLGVADGSVASVLTTMGCRVWGIDIDPDAAEVAREVCEEVIVADLSAVDLVECFNRQRFDVVLMLDVLEHLTDPAGLLRRLAPVLEDGGWAVISVPNVAHASVRLALLDGRFTYTDVGLLDRTHLRFFDRDGVANLLRDAGWEMFDMARVTYRAGSTEIPIGDADPELVQRLESDIEGLTYQFVVSVAPIGSPVIKHPPVLPAAVAHSALLKTLAETASMMEGARTRESELNATHHALAADLEVLRGEYQQLDASLQERTRIEAGLIAARDSLVAELETLGATYVAVDGELGRLRNTKLFRWSAPMRKLYARLRDRADPGALAK
jgi:2-polyprenyl-3-methyl-5-hydroxy-6-metoxy-1,4-benzoquinol methylase